jgi:O-acetylserine/cysteine efflux transporter
VLAHRIGNVGAMSLVVWSSLASPLPLLALSLVFEGPSAIGLAVASLTWLSVGALAYLVVLSFLLGYGVWNYLIVQHGAGRVAPFSMLVPIFGIASSTIALREIFTPWHAISAALVLAGLALHVFGRPLFGTL